MLQMRLKTSISTLSAYLSSSHTLNIQNRDLTYDFLFDVTLYHAYSTV